MKKLIYFVDFVDLGTKYDNKVFVKNIIDFINDNQQLFINYYKLNKYGTGKIGNIEVEADRVSNNPILSSLLDILIYMKYKENGDSHIEITEKEGNDLVKMSDFLQRTGLERTLFSEILRGNYRWT